MDDVISCLLSEIGIGKSDVASIFKTASKSKN